MTSLSLCNGWWYILSTLLSSELIYHCGCQWVSVGGFCRAGGFSRQLGLTPPPPFCDSLPLLQLFSVIRRWPAGPSEVFVSASACERLFVCLRGREMNTQRGNKKGEWEGGVCVCGNTTTSCLAAHTHTLPAPCVTRV